MTELARGSSGVRSPAGFSPGGRIARAPAVRGKVAAPERFTHFVWAYWVSGVLVAAASFLYGGIEVASLAIAAVIALWAFFEPRISLWLCTAYMVFLFVFFQTSAPLGDEVPEEFFYWGTGIALITASLLAATILSSQVNWAITRTRLALRASIAMFGMLLIILAATVYGLFAGNQMFAVVRQLFGCLLLPVYYFLGLALFRSAADIDLWLTRVSSIVALGSAWYVERLSLISLSHGTYYREQSPLVAYSGAVAVIAWSQLATRRRMGLWLRAVALLVVCVLAILLMGNRAALGSFLAAAAAITLIAVWRQRVFSIALVCCLLPIGMGITPYIMTRLTESRGLAGYITDRYIFVLADDHSYQGRVAQTEVVMNIVGQNPILGAGMGSENTFIIPSEQRRVKVASVDNGWGYLLLKMGYVGLAAFLLLVGQLLKRGFSGLGSVRSPALRGNRVAVFGVFLYALVSFLGGPTFFHFSVSPFFATALAALIVLAEVREAAPAADFAAKRAALTTRGTKASTAKDNPPRRLGERNDPCWN